MNTCDIIGIVCFGLGCVLSYVFLTIRFNILSERLVRDIINILRTNRDLDRRSHEKTNTLVS